jgi:prevent-host-death family protein
MSKKIVIGAYEAKTRLPELLRQVLEGKTFTITNRGQPVAELSPCRPSKPSAREAIDRFLAVRRAAPATQRVSIRALIEDGRA